MHRSHHAACVYGTYDTVCMVHMTSLNGTQESHLHMDHCPASMVVMNLHAALDTHDYICMVDMKLLFM